MHARSIAMPDGWTDEEFEVVMKVPRDQFASLKPWKRQQLKRNAGLF